MEESPNSFSSKDPSTSKKIEKPDLSGEETPLKKLRADGGGDLLIPTAMDEDDPDKEEMDVAAPEGSEMITLHLSPPPFGPRGHASLELLKKDLLGKRHLSCEYSIFAFQPDKAMNDLLEKVVVSARILNLDEVELYFVGDGDNGPYSPTNELESLKSVLSTLNSLYSGDTSDQIKVSLETLNDKVCDWIKSYANEDLLVKFTDMSLYDSFDDMAEELLRWGERNGMRSKLRIAGVSEGGRGAVASVDINICDIVLEIPKSLIISEDRLLSSDMSAVLKNICSTSEEKFVLWIMKERHKSDSEFALYFKTLPENFNIGFSFGPNALDVLKGTELGDSEAICDHLDDLKDQFALIYPLLLRHPHIFPVEQYTLEQYLWAYKLLFSYGMVVFLPNGKQKKCLIPVAGFFNHSQCPHVLSSLEESETGNLKFVAARPLKKGQQCYISYGNFTSSYFVTHYGFLPKGVNHHDVIEIDNSFDYECVTRYKRYGGDDGRWYYRDLVRGTWFNNGGKFGLPQPLLDKWQFYFKLRNIENSGVEIAHSLMCSVIGYLHMGSPNHSVNGKEENQHDRENLSWDVKLALEYKDSFAKLQCSVLDACRQLAHYHWRDGN